MGQHLISELEIQRRIVQLAQRIAKDYDGQEFVIVAVLKGAFMFAADLVRLLTKQGSKAEIDFICAASYGSDVQSSGDVQIKLDVEVTIKEKHILIVDDIIDTGYTLSKIYKYLLKKGAVDVRTCVLLDKPSHREVEFKPEYIGFEIPDYFVIGYGLDCAERGRCLPYITVSRQ